MPEQPSYTHSTLSQAFALTTGCYLLLILTVAAGLIWWKLPVEVAEKIIGWMSAFWAVVSGAYLTARKVAEPSVKP